MKLVILLLVSGSLAACSKGEERIPAQDNVRKGSGFHFDRLPVAEVIRKLGDPIRRRKASGQPGAELLDFANNQTCQTENQRVVICFRSPRQGEESLQYWRNLWRGVEQNYEEVGEVNVFDAPARFKLTAPTLKLGVVYNPDDDRIVRVVSYGKPL